MTRLTEVGFPLDLTLAETDLRTLLYKVALQVHEQLAARSVSVEVQVAPELGGVDEENGEGG